MLDWADILQKHAYGQSAGTCTVKQVAQGLGALLDKMEDNDHIKLDNIHVEI